LVGFNFSSDDAPQCNQGLTPPIDSSYDCFVVAGTYDVTETDPSPNAWLTSLSCDDSDSTGDVPTRTATIVAAAGEHVTCTFTNTLQA
jgi:hypothetical protein